MKPLIWSSVRLPRLLQSQQLPEGNDRVEVAVGFNYRGEGSTDRWFYPIYELALPQESLAGARKFWLTVPTDNNNANNYDGAIGPTLSAAFETAMADSWHHLALTHKVEGGQDVWKLYIDGDNMIEGTEATVRKGQSGAFAFGNYRNLYFGGRPESNANRLNASFDYWRVSDKALEPSEFLCAEAAVPGSGESMVAYLGPEGSTHSQWISAGVSLKGDARKTCTVEIWAHPLSGSNIDQQSNAYFAEARASTFRLAAKVPLKTGSSNSGRKHSRRRSSSARAA